MAKKILLLFSFFSFFIGFSLISSFYVTSNNISLMKEQNRDFVETIRYKGFVTDKMYYSYLKKFNIPVSVSFEHRKNKDVTVEKDVIDAVFTKEILDEISKNKIYKFNKNDEIVIRVRKRGITFFEANIKALTGLGFNKDRIISKEGGVILNEQYH